MILYNYNSYEHNPFPMLFSENRSIKSEKDLAPGGALILWGGEDISPTLYGEIPNSFCYVYRESDRDTFEIKLIQTAIKLNIPIIGICRGAQLLCVMAGGKVAQHIENHGRSHTVTLHDEDDVEVSTNSSHHQMMLPPASAKVLATSKKVVGCDQFDSPVEYPRCNEVVWFPSINALGIQPHPEWLNCPQAFYDYCERKIREYIL